MSPGGEVLVGLAILVGLFGAATQIIPGGLIVLAAIGVWAAVTGGGAAWSVFAVAVVAVAASGVAKYYLAGRHLRRSEVSTTTLLWGGAAGIVGFFVIPVLGLFVGFVLGVYLAEYARRREHAAAWQATKAALKATGITILVELAGALIAAGAWLAGVLWLT